MIKAIITFITLTAGVAMAAVVVHMQTDPMAFTHPAHVQNVTLKVKPVHSVEQPPPIIAMAPMVISIPKHDVGAGKVRKSLKKSVKQNSPCQYRVIGYSDSNFQKFRGVFYCVDNGSK